MRRVKLAIVLALLANVSGCSDEHGSPTEANGSEASLVSEPVQTAGSVQGSSVISPTRTVFVSLRSGTLPASAALATILHPASGMAINAPVVDLGLDPVAVQAAVGDDISVVVRGDDAAILRTFSATVPAFHRPYVVRTIPARGKKAVPLNARIVIVFSEPVTTSSSAGIRLLSNGAPVAGRAEIATDGLRAEFHPGQMLQPNSDYVLSVSAVTDLRGEALQQPATAEFSTGSSIAIASISTDEPALLRNPFNDEMRTFEMSAVLAGDGTFSGTFSVYYANTGKRNSGHITCFSIVDGKAAWVGGVIDEGTAAAVGKDWGWRMLDNGARTDGVPDELSLAFPLVEDSLGTAQDFCRNRPVSSPNDGDVELLRLVSGNIVITGATPMPPLPGNLKVITATSGSEFDPDGYTVCLDPAPLAESGYECSGIDVNGSWVIPADAGSHEVWLLDAAPNCTINGSNPRNVAIPEAEAVEVTFQIQCDHVEILVPFGAAGYRFQVLADSNQSGAGFESSAFDDMRAEAGFSTGDAPFGVFTSDAIECETERTVRTDWPAGTDLLLRRTFVLPAGTSSVRISLAIDNDARLFVNGVDITASAGSIALAGGYQRHEGCATRDSFVFSVPNEVAHAGTNLLAVRARDRGVVSFADLQITAKLP